MTSFQCTDCWVLLYCEYKRGRGLKVWLSAIFWPWNSLKSFRFHPLPFDNIKPTIYTSLFLPARLQVSNRSCCKLANKVTNPSFWQLLRLSLQLYSEKFVLLFKTESNCITYFKPHCTLHYNKLFIYHLLLLNHLLTSSGQLSSSRGIYVLSDVNKWK